MRDSGATADNSAAESTATILAMGVGPGNNKHVGRLRTTKHKHRSNQKEAASYELDKFGAHYAIKGVPARGVPYC